MSHISHCDRGGVVTATGDSDAPDTLVFFDENSNEYKPEALEVNSYELSEEKDLSKYCDWPIGQGTPATWGDLGADGFKSSGTCCKKNDNDISEDKNETQDESSIAVVSVADDSLVDGDPAFFTASRATDFFSAPHIVSREILGELGPLINTVQDIVAENPVLSVGIVVAPTGVDDDAEVFNMMQECIKARVPSPSERDKDKFSIVSRNIRNLLTHRHDAMDCQANMQVLQECDLMEHQQFIVNNALRQAQWQGYYGDVTDISIEEGKRRGRRVATFVKSDTDTSVKFKTDDPDYRYLMDTGRWVEVTLPTEKTLEDGTRFYITVANIYGISGASQGGEKHSANERMLAAAGRRASTFTDHPYYLFGDFNDDLKHSKVLTALVEQQVLFDIAAEFTKPGQPIQNTFSRDVIKQGMVGSGKTRIDFLFSNDVGIRVVDSFEYLFDETQGFDHLPMKLTLNIKAFTHARKWIF